MRKMLYAVLVSLFIGGLSIDPATASDHDKNPADESGSGVNLESLLKAELEGFEGAEVIVSRVTFPPHSSLPKHWHPGEEFAYILEGSVILWQDGEDDLVGQAGDVIKIPLKKVHTARTGDESATVLVFRVHEQGKPERALVE
ncbi:MAG: cupin domain-containing protein [Candidatus Krumholzibacteriota bacterium]